MSSTAPILIMSSERSGSNLLRTLLSNHPSISGPMAPQFLSLVPPLAPDFEPLDHRDHMVALVELMLAIANHRQFSWRLDVDARALVNEHEPRDTLGAFDMLYRAAQSRDGAQRYVCKENSLFEHAPALMERFPGTRILYLVRDPRDYALSWEKAPLLNHTPYESACTWRDEQRACFAIEERFGDAVLRLTYEDLVSDPKASMTATLEHVGEEVHEACFQVQAKKNKDQEWSSFWKNLTKPVQSTNHAKYRTELSPEVLEIIETVCAAEMAAIGYEAETAQSWRKGLMFSRRERKLAEANDARLREEHAETVAVIEDRNRLVQELVAARREMAADKGAAR
ncbi:MAG: sulfotransferase [Planctomycetota bacterium]